MSYHEKYDYKYRRRSQSGWAVILITVGLVFLLRNLGVIPYPLSKIVISWQMLLIAMGGWHIFRRSYATGGILMSLGVIFILPKIDRLYPELNLNIPLLTHQSWPIILIIVGVFTLAGQFIDKIQLRNYYKKRDKKQLEDDRRETTISDSEREEKHNN